MNNLSIVNVYNSKKTIYLFCREDDGALKIVKDNSYAPYYYELDPKGEYTAIDGKKVRKITVNDPREIREIRSHESYEADIHYCKKYVVDKIDKFEKSNIKWAMIDIEVLKRENEFPDPLTAKFPVTSITIYNSKYDKIRNWFIGDYGAELANAEVLLFKDFIEYMRKACFDLLLGYYMEDFDYPYLYSRFQKLEGIQKYLFEKESDYNNFATAISPIGKVRGGKKDYNNFYPAGTSIVDYLTWMKKIYKSEKSYGLDAIAEKYLKVGKKYKEVDFSKIREEVKLRNIDDVELMVKLEKEKFHFIPLFDEIRRFAKVNWEDFGFNSRIIDALLLQEAKEKKIVLPNGKSYETTTDEFEGAFRETFQSGALFNIGDYDLNSAYPQILQDLCLDSSNIVNEKGDNVIEVNVNDRETKEIKNTYLVKQDENALLPSAVKKLLVKKAMFKKLMEDTNPESEEFKGIELTYDGIKNIINSFWGVLGNRFFRLYDARLASMITSSIRDLLLYLKTKTEEAGYKVVYVDTDSVFVEDSNQDLSDFLNKTIQQWSMERFNKKVNISISKKGNFEKILILTMCRYKGWMRTTKGLKEEIKGIQVKRKDSTIFIAKFQDTLIDKILNKESQEQIIDWIKLEIERLKTLPIEEISFPAKLSQAPELYKTEVTNKHGKTYSKEPPVFVRALKNAPKLNKRVGDNYLWIYVKSEDPKKNALAFDDKNKSHITEIDYEKMTERNIYNIIETIFEAMKWDLSVIMPQKVRKPRKNAKIALDLSTGTLQEGDNKLKQGIIPVKKKTKSANLTQPIETK
jgi:DNA polymerase elongation subunit (family B)